MVTQRLSLDMITGGQPSTVYVDQYDNCSRRLLVQLFVRDEPFIIPENTTVTLESTLPSGKSCILTASEVSEDTVAFVLTSDITEEAGTALCGVRLTRGEERAGSQNFNLVIQQRSEPYI